MEPGTAARQGTASEDPDVVSVGGVHPIDHRMIRWRRRGRRSADSSPTYTYTILDVLVEEKKREAASRGVWFDEPL